MTKMVKCLLFLLCSSSVVGMSSVHAQEKAIPCSQMQYENNNMVDYGPLRVSNVMGIVRDVQGYAVGQGCVGVFSDDGKTLIAFAEIHADGSFQIINVRAGNYRLVVAGIQGFCAANAKIRVGRSIHKKRGLVAMMKPRGVDQCSWIDAK